RPLKTLLMTRTRSIGTCVLPEVTRMCIATPNPDRRHETRDTRHETRDTRHTSPESEQGEGYSPSRALGASVTFSCLLSRVSCLPRVSRVLLGRQRRQRAGLHDVDDCVRQFVGVHLHAVLRRLVPLADARLADGHLQTVLPVGVA